MVSTDYKLEILAEAQRLIFFEKAWSKNCAATKAGEMCPPWDLHADAWSLFGAIEKVLTDRNEYRHLLDIAAIICQNINEPLLAFDSNHSHDEVIELLYLVMGKIAESNGLNMYRPCFTLDSDDVQDDGFVMFVPKEFDEQLEADSKAQSDKMNEVLLENALYVMWDDE